MSKKQDNRVKPGDEITVLRRGNSNTTKRISVVDRKSEGRYTVHADDTMKDTTKILKHGAGTGKDQVDARLAKGYVKG